MSLLVNGLIRAYGGWAWSRFDRCADNPFQSQETLLLDILRKNQSGVFGKAHGFKSIRSVRDYQRQVPISDYEDIRPFVDRVMAGEKEVLTTNAPIRFNVTSGTTGLPKYIPITREGGNQEMGLIRQWYSKALLDHPGFLDNDRAAIVGSAVEGSTLLGTPYGSASGMIIQRIPSFIRRRYAIPDALFELKDYDERYFLMARCAVARDISFLLTPNPSTLIRLAGLMKNQAGELIRAIHDGTPGGKIAVAPVHFRPDPARAAFLEHIVGRTGTLRPQDVWPALRLISCWLGGSAGAQAQKLVPDYGKVPIRDCGYMASEAHITLPIQDHTPAGVLTVQTNFYEFIPEACHGDKNPPVLSCHELETGQCYAILLTTRNGLYRYDLNDIVEVGDFYHRVPTLVFVRKGRDMTNITGEKMHTNHFLSVMEEAQRKFGIGFEQFRAVPDIDRSRYRVLIEPGGNLSDNFSGEGLLDFIDQSLARVNREYGQKRASRRLHSPTVSFMRRGWAEEEFRRYQKAGKSDIQFKWCVLCPEMKPEDAAAVMRTIEKGESLD